MTPYTLLNSTLQSSPTTFSSRQRRLHIEGDPFSGSTSWIRIIVQEIYGAPTVQVFAVDALANEVRAVRVCEGVREDVSLGSDRGLQHYAPTQETMQSEARFSRLHEGPICVEVLVHVRKHRGWGYCRVCYERFCPGTGTKPTHQTSDGRGHSPRVGQDQVDRPQHRGQNCQFVALDEKSVYEGSEHWRGVVESNQGLV